MCTIEPKITVTTSSSITFFPYTNDCDSPTNTGKICECTTKEDNDCDNGDDNEDGDDYIT